MTLTDWSRSFLLAGMLVLLAACSSSGSDNTDELDPLTNSDTRQGNGETDDDELLDDSSEDSGESTPPDSEDVSGNTNEDTPPDSEDVSGNTNENTPPESEDVSGNTNEDTPPESEDVSGNTNEDTPPESEDVSGNTNEDNPPDSEDASIFQPPVAPGSDLARLISALTRQTALTLLDLNSRLSGGEQLSTQQSACLGDYKIGSGEPLLAIDCTEELAVDEVKRVSVSEATFHDTDVCQSALFKGKSEGCILQNLSLLVETEFVVLETGTPNLVYPGATVDYAVDELLLEINSLPDALASEYSCMIDLQALTFESLTNATDCDATIKNVAHRLELLQNVIFDADR